MVQLLEEERLHRRPDLRVTWNVGLHEGQGRRGVQQEGGVRGGRGRRGKLCQTSRILIETVVGIGMGPVACRVEVCLVSILQS